MGTTTVLRTLRGQARLSQRQLAAAAGLNITTIVNLEAGRSQPQAATIGKLARPLGVPYLDLFYLFYPEQEAAS